MPDGVDRHTVFAPAKECAATIQGFLDAGAKSLVLWLIWPDVVQVAGGYLCGQPFLDALNVPDLPSVFPHRAIAREFTNASDIQNRFARPD